MSTTEARFGFARFGATRFAAMTRYLFVSIDGVDRSSDVLEGSVSHLEATSDETGTASFTMIIGATTPDEDSLVTIGLGARNRLQFGGQVETVVRNYRSEDLDNPVVVINCTDWRKIFDKSVVNEVYRNVSATVIVKDIGRYTPGFDYHEVEAGLPVIDFVAFSDIYPSECLRQVATALGSGADWLITPSRRVAFWGVGGRSSPYAPTRPQTINADNLTAMIPFSATRETSQRRTQVIVNARRTKSMVSTPAGAETITIEAGAQVEYLVQAGGGGGGDLRNGGGGGGGNLRGSAYLNANTYAVVVGDGGAAATNGQNSSFGTLVAIGGGHGSISGTPADGGSGGGASNTNRGGSGTSGQGYNGGDGNLDLSAAGGGGGGAGAPGGNAGPNAGGNGGDGVLSSIDGTPTYYGGGGCGNGVSSSGSGGLGGGGGDSVGVGLPGTDGTGGGGGAGAGGANKGGSGKVIMRFPIGALSATGGTITFAGGYQVHTFTTNGNFVVSDVTVTAPPAIVTDIPVADVSQIDADAGTVKIGTRSIDYASLGGPTVAPGDNPPGTTLTADANLLDTSLSMDTTVITSSPGWVKLGDQIVRYTSTDGSHLLGVPALGFGALQAPVKSGAAVTWLGSVVFTTGVSFEPPLSVDDDVIQRITVDDLTAQAALALREDTDGIHSYVIEAQDSTRPAATALGVAYLSKFAAAAPSSSWDTEDLNAHAGSPQPISLGDFSAVLTIQRVESVYDVINQPPRKSVEAGIVKTPRLLDVVAVKA